MGEALLDKTLLGRYKEMATKEIDFEVENNVEQSWKNLAAQRFRALWCMESVTPGQSTKYDKVALSSDVDAIVNYVRRVRYDMSSYWERYFLLQKLRFPDDSGLYEASKANIKDKVLEVRRKFRDLYLDAVGDKIKKLGDEKGAEIRELIHKVAKKNVFGWKEFVRDSTEPWEAIRKYLAKKYTVNKTIDNSRMTPLERYIYYDSKDHRKKTITDMLKREFRSAFTKYYNEQFPKEIEFELGEKNDDWKERVLRAYDTDSKQTEWKDFVKNMYYRVHHDIVTIDEADVKRYEINELPKQVSRRVLGFVDPATRALRVTRGQRDISDIITTKAALPHKCGFLLGLIENSVLFKERADEFRKTLTGEKDRDKTKDRDRLWETVIVPVLKVLQVEFNREDEETEYFLTHTGPLIVWFLCPSQRRGEDFITRYRVALRILGHDGGNLDKLRAFPDDMTVGQVRGTRGRNLQFLNIFDAGDTVKHVRQKYRGDDDRIEGLFVDVVNSFEESEEVSYTAQTIRGKFFTDAKFVTELGRRVWMPQPDDDFLVRDSVTVDALAISHDEWAKRLGLASKKDLYDILQEYTGNANMDREEFVNSDELIEALRFLELEKDSGEYLVRVLMASDVDMEGLEREKSNMMGGTLRLSVLKREYEKLQLEGESKLEILRLVYGSSGHGSTISDEHVQTVEDDIAEADEEEAEAEGEMEIREFDFLESAINVLDKTDKDVLVLWYKSAIKELVQVKAKMDGCKDMMSHLLEYQPGTEAYLRAMGVVPFPVEGNAKPAKKMRS